MVVRRAEAIFLHYQAPKPDLQTNWLPVLEELANASSPTVHWRQRRNLRDASLITAIEDRRLANDILSRLPDGKLKTHIEKRLSTLDSTDGYVRAFFWK